MGQTAAAPARFETVNGHGQLLSIQYLRGFAALSVLVTHVLQWPIAEYNMGLLKTGRLGVEVFFVISGFIMTMIAGHGTFKPQEFLGRRAIRIVPAYWAATVLVTVLALAMPNQFRTTVPSFEGFIKSLLFIPSIEPKAPLLTLGWTLDYEAFFYVVFASLFFLESRARTAVLCGLFTVLIAIGLMLNHPSHVQAFYTSMSLAGFCCGTVLAQFYRSGIAMRGPLARSLALAALPVLLALFYLIPWDNAEHALLPVHLLMSATAICIVLIGLQIEVAGRLPRSAVLKFIGDTSYSLYLFHIFAVAAVWGVAKRLFDVQQPLVYIAFTLLAITAGLVFAWVCYRLVERPFLTASRNWRRNAVPA
ncbi:acyltransferase [Bradyrhizobium prioriisuperbiae]|uniref:acyltransferase family protein n=1 Tax=Bradyrhizobium prioriisuperbiae TaxID=2854389 RepID=UPI0028E853D6|nr:acyltransferase [Bradyrhizobium prioritasuperba]